MPGPGGHRGGFGGGPRGGGFGRPRGGHGGFGGRIPPMHHGWGHRPPMHHGWGHRPYRGGCLGCCIPVVGTIALFAMAIAALVILL